MSDKLIAQTTGWYWVEAGTELPDGTIARSFMLEEITRLTDKEREMQAKIHYLTICNANLVGMIKVLIEKEWIEDQEYGSFCPFCEGQKPIEITSKMDQKDIDVINEINKIAGHFPSCIRQRALVLIGENK